MRKLAWLWLLPLLGCGRSCDDHPYVPYAIGDEAIIDAGAAAFAGSFDAEATTIDASSSLARAPEDAGAWDVFGVNLVAPEDRVLSFARVVGRTSDAAYDVLAVVKPKNAPGPLEVIDYRVAAGRVEAPRVLLSTKDNVLDASCSPAVTAEERGASALSLSLSFTCAGHGDPPARTFALFQATPSGPRARFAARVRDHESDAPLAVDLDTTDVDHDGVADVTLIVETAGAKARVVLFDRPSGLSRDIAEPETSLAALERSAAARLDKKDAKGALALLQKLRILYRALCQEPSPRVSPLAGVAAFSCGQNTVNNVLRKSEVTLARALAQDGERLRALFELDVAMRLGEKVDPKILAPWVDGVTVKETRTFDRAASKPPTGVPSFSPLLFDAQGQLVIRVSDADAGAMHADPAASQDPLPSWPLSVRSPDAAQRLIGAYDPCDEARVLLTFAGATSMEDVALGVEPLLGRKCEGTRGGVVSVAPIAWTSGGLAMMVFGQYVHIAPTLEASNSTLPADLASGKGGAGSAAGPYVVVRTPLGIALDDGKKASILRDAEKKPITGSYCVVANDGTHVACLVGDKPVLYGL